MRIYIYSGETYGTNYYRAQLVRRYLEKRGHQAVHSIHLFPDFAKDFDVVFMVRPLMEYISIDVIHMLKRYGVPVVIDCDDRLDAVPVWSPSSQFFNPWQKKDYYRWVFDSADLITASCRYMGESIGRDVGCPVHVVPNAFDTDYKLLRPVRILQQNEQPVVGWMGGAQHKQDLASIEKVWNTCLERGYKLRFLGDTPDCILGKKNTEMVMGTHHVEMYLQIVPLVKLDVGLAPLIDCEFNRCKSNLKALEYRWLAGCPTVLQDMETYEDIQEDGEYIFKVKGNDADEWLAKIEIALQTMRNKGSKYSLDSGFTMNETIDLWIRSFETACTIVRGESPSGPVSGNGGGYQPLVAVGAKISDGIVSLGGLPENAIQSIKSE